MKITIDNYEQYVLDYLDGNLNFEDEILFEDFLDRYPDIRAEIEGVDQFVLTPDMEITYPDKADLYRKKQGVILPFWNVSQMVAAAVVLLLVSATIFFFWKSSENQPSLLSVNPLPEISTTEGGKEETITRSPMPEILPEQKQDAPDEPEHEQTEASEQGVMALQEKRSVQPPIAHQNAPALTSGVTVDHLKPAAQQTGISIANGSQNPVPIPNSSDRPDPEIAVLDVEKLRINPHSNDAVAYLPLKQHEITIEPGLPASYAQVHSPKADDETFKIHIPREFLSETWGDVSVARFKKKLLPEFIKNQLNL